ncbi:MAG: c-type cytochrome biogenesis protein CcsB [Deltaproteobacteria bacterium]|nr:MAG: c-type cytochrome biogenesis protein CcsB [Deltaproteobacteria bacterium]
MSQLSENLTLVSIVLYSLSALLYALMWLRSSKTLRIGAPLVLVAGFIVNFFQLLSRWHEANQPPFKTLYESLVLLSACIAIVYLVIEFIYRARILGLPAMLGAAGAMLYAFSRHDKEIVNLPPALQSGWFIPHVVVYFFGYAALFVAFCAAVLYLIRPKPIRIRREDLIPGEKIDLEKLLDGSVRFGFVLLTFGLLVGAVWAKMAWGDYWVWDPKETWSLVTWLMFAAYLHLHYLGGWRGKRLAVLVVLGFVAVMFTYLGMNLLPTAEQSAHVYQ